MKVLKARLRWNNQYANEPGLMILVDHIPAPLELRYQTKALEMDCTAYFAELDGYVHFLLHDPKSERGFGGHRFEIILDTEEKVIVPGPWSSRSAVMNGLGFTPSIEASLTDDSNAFYNAGTMRAGYITQELFHQTMARFFPNVRVEPGREDMPTIRKPDFSHVEDYRKNHFFEVSDGESLHRTVRIFVGEDGGIHHSDIREVTY